MADSMSTICANLSRSLQYPRRALFPGIVRRDFIRRRGLAGGLFWVAYNFSQSGGKRFLVIGLSKERLIIIQNLAQRRQIGRKYRTLTCCIFINFHRRRVAHGNLLFPRIRDDEYIRSCLPQRHLIVRHMTNNADIWSVTIHLSESPQIPLSAAYERNINLRHTLCSARERIDTLPRKEMARVDGKRPFRVKVQFSPRLIFILVRKLRNIDRARRYDDPLARNTMLEGKLRVPFIDRERKEYAREERFIKPAVSLRNDMNFVHRPL